MRPARSRPGGTRVPTSVRPPGVRTRIPRRIVETADGTRQGCGPHASHLKASTVVETKSINYGPPQLHEVLSGPPGSQHDGGPSGQAESEPWKAAAL